MIKNGESTKLLSIIRKAEKEGGVSKLETSELTEAVFLMYALSKTIEVYEPVFKEILLERGIEKTVSADHELKIELKEGRSSSEIDTEKVFSQLPLATLSKICNVVEGRIKDLPNAEDVAKVVALYKTVRPSNKKIVSVSKLNKSELQSLKG